MARKRTRHGRRGLLLGLLLAAAAVALRLLGDRAAAAEERSAVRQTARHAGEAAGAAATPAETPPQPASERWPTPPRTVPGQSRRDRDRRSRPLARGRRSPLTSSASRSPTPCCRSRRAPPKWSRLRAAHAEILCHLPLEGRSGADPGPGAVLEEHSARRLARRVREAIDAVPGAVGLNNHMGSIVTADREAMAALLDVVAERGCSSSTRAPRPRRRLRNGAPRRRADGTARGLSRQRTRTGRRCAPQFERLLAVARERGAAIAIGHPHAVTLDALDELVPRAVADGYEFVPVSYLLERDAPHE
jgi:uncharacterized protein